ncbi:murein biosynthesis integral membrane protein MurJ [Clostridium gasigenes]|uniref:murein biosynthesis integral membrane protein MurJ n=1 Tax=Clostridium gasigenes TaxID=94869 RepID=UPI001C0CB230|nr:murein biosynthesis integral membrane protein MurJ [Clostridium gasigenes]MBU3138156.1 murein biosynthesis integral membrane protein MurJ [Clostridium gasigenes]
MKNNMFKTVSILIIMNLASKVLGFTRDYFTAIKFGTSLEADAYLMASNIPNILFVIIGTAITTTIIPIYNDIKCNRSKKELNIFLNNIITILLIISVTITIFCEFKSTTLVNIMAPGFEGYKYDLTVFLTRILSSVIILNTLIYIFTAILQCENMFTLPASIGIPYNIILIFYYIIFSERYGVVGIAIATSIALVIQVVLLLMGLKKLEYKYRFYINIKDENLKKIVKLLIPICIGTGMTQINGIFNGIFASSLESGSVASINYALKLNSLIIDIIIISITTVIYQNTTKIVAQKGIGAVNEESNRGIVTMFIVLVPVVLVASLYCEDIVKFLFERGQFDSVSTAITANAFFYYSLGLFAIAINSILSRVCYALGDTKTPMINTFFAIIVNISFGFLLKDILGVGGIALASSIGSVLSVILLYFNVRKKIPNCISKNTITVIIKLFIASIPLVIIIMYSKNFIIDINTTKPLVELIKMSISIVSGVIMYLLILLILKVKEIKNIFSTILKFER